MIMQDPEPIITLLYGMKGLGLKLLVDDFGTGYSSLSYLKRFPLNTLKIDQSLIQGLSSNSNDESMTVGIIAMAHSLQMRVVAEGVETLEQLEFLRRKGCDDVQGFYYSKSLPLQELKVFLEKHRNGFSKVR